MELSRPQQLEGCQQEHKEKWTMKIVVIASFVLSVGGMVTVTTDAANAAVYCQYIDYPPSCVARPGVVLRPRPVARAVARPGTPMNRGGPVNRVGRR
jgi:hypothetical protein